MLAPKVSRGWRSTRIRLLPNNEVIVPNSKLAVTDFMKDWNAAMDALSKGQGAMPGEILGLLGIRYDTALANDLVIGPQSNLPYWPIQGPALIAMDMLQRQVYLYDGKTPATWGVDVYTLNAACQGCWGLFYIPEGSTIIAPYSGRAYTREGPLNLGGPSKDPTKVCERTVSGPIGLFSPQKDKKIYQILCSL